MFEQFIESSDQKEYRNNIQKIMKKTDEIKHISQLIQLPQEPKGIQIVSPDQPRVEDAI